MADARAVRRGVEARWKIFTTVHWMSAYYHRSPTLAELAEVTEYGKTTVRHHLLTLADQGLVYYGGGHRTASLTNDGWTWLDIGGPDRDPQPGELEQT